MDLIRICPKVQELVVYLGFHKLVILKLQKECLEVVSSNLELLWCKSGLSWIFGSLNEEMPEDIKRLLSKDQPMG